MWKTFVFLEKFLEFSENRPESAASVISLGSDGAGSVQENGKVQEKIDREELDEDDLHYDQVRKENS